MRTLLARLVEKGALEYEVDGARYIYRAVVSRQECVRQEGRWFAEKVFGGNVSGPPKGVGFQKDVRFNHRTIIR